MDASRPLTILSFAVFAAMFATVVNGCILIPCKMEKMVLKTTIAAAITNIITNFVAIPFFAQNGAAVTTVLAECVVFIIGWKYAKKYVKIENLSKVIATSIAGCIVIIALNSIICNCIESYVVRLIVKVPFCMVGYGISLFIMKNEIVVEYFNNLIKVLRKQR